MENKTIEKTSKGLSEFDFNIYQKVKWTILHLFLWIVLSRATGLGDFIIYTMGSFDIKNHTRTAEHRAQLENGDLIVICNQGVVTERIVGEKIAVVLKVKGKVSIIRGHKTSQNILRRGSCLKDRDKLITDKNSFITVRFIEDSNLLRIRPNSICVFKGKKIKNKVIDNVSMELETILTRVTGQRPSIKISKPTSVAAVK
jgi:hypothetical protein